MPSASASASDDDDTQTTLRRRNNTNTANTTSTSSPQDSESKSNSPHLIVIPDNLDDDRPPLFPPDEPSSSSDDEETNFDPNFDPNFEVAAPPPDPDPNQPANQPPGEGLNLQQQLQDRLRQHQLPPPPSPFLLTFTFYKILSYVLPLLLLAHTSTLTTSFYDTVVLLSNDKLSLLTLVNLYAIVCIQTFNLITSLFIQNLKPSETSDLSDFIKVTLTDLCLALNIFRDSVDFSMLFRVGAVLVVKCLGR